MRTFQFFALALLLFIPSAIAQSAKIKPSDLKKIEGEWVGNLTYLDYSSNKKFSIKSNLKVAAAPDERAWTFDYLYPDEPKANGKSDVKLSVDGRTFNDQTVIEKTRLKNGVLKIVTTKEGTDNDKNALFRYTYLIGPNKFSVMKEVRNDGTGQFFERNTYTWSR